jgi:hypothetical protein
MLQARYNEGRVIQINSLSVNLAHGAIMYRFGLAEFGTIHCLDNNLKASNRG